MVGFAFYNLVRFVFRISCFGKVHFINIKIAAFASWLALHRTGVGIIATKKGHSCHNLQCLRAHVAGAWTERKKIFHGGSFLKLADDNMDIQNPEAQNRELAGF